jgi:DNA repair protein RadC
MAALEQEQLRTLNLNTKNRILSAPMIYQGTLDSTHVRIAEVFRPALIDNAAALIVAHNHPSGDTTPSPEDVQLTRQLIEAGRLLDINVLDHIIIGREGFASLREQGLVF